MNRYAVLFLGLLVLGGCNNLRLGVPAPVTEPVDAPAPPLVERWERSVEGGFGPTAPVILGEQILVGTRKGDVVLLNAETGRIDGRQAFGASIEGAMDFSDDRHILYVPSASPGRITAHDVVRGERAWRWKARDLGTPDAGVVHLDGTVIAPLTDGHVVGLDAADGTVRWRVRYDSTASISAAPLVSGGRVIVADDRGAIRSLDPQTGRSSWSVSVDAPVDHTPAQSSDGALFVPTTRGDIVQVFDDGRIGWRVSLADGERVPPRVGAPTYSSADGGLVLAGATNGRLVAVDASTGAVRWTRDFDAHVNGAPLVSTGFVFVGLTDQRVLALDLATGETRWEAPVRGRVKSGLAAADGLVIVLTEPRHVVAFGPQTP